MGNDVLHRAAFTPGTFSGNKLFAACGARRIDGIEFTTLVRRVTAPYDSTGAWESRDVLPSHGPDFSEWCDASFAVREFPR